MAVPAYCRVVPMPEETAALLRLAKQLREAAAQAGRADVVDRTDDLVLLIADGPATPHEQGPGKSDTVVRILNGLGF